MKNLSIYEIINSSEGEELESLLVAKGYPLGTKAYRGMFILPFFVDFYVLYIIKFNNMSLFFSSFSSSIKDIIDLMPPSRDTLSNVGTLLPDTLDKFTPLLERVDIDYPAYEDFQKNMEKLNIYSFKRSFEKWC
jgi:hypothetical protein